MKRMTLGSSALLLVLAATGAAAQEQSSAPQPETRAEAQTRAGVLFDQLDLNHDGKLDAADRALRANGPSNPPDTGHDGSPEHSDAGDSPQGHQHMGHWGYDHQEMHGLVRLILHRADPGHVGTVTRDPFVKAALTLFDEADTDHDGVLTVAEQHAAAEAMHQRMEARRAGLPPRADGDALPPLSAPPPGN